MAREFLNMQLIYQTYVKAINALRDDTQAQGWSKNLFEVIQEAAVIDKELSNRIKTNPICKNINPKFKRPLKRLDLPKLITQLENISHGRHITFKLLEPQMLKTGKTAVTDFRNITTRFAGILAKSLTAKKKAWINQLTSLEKPKKTLPLFGRIFKKGPQPRM